MSILSSKISELNSVTTVNMAAQVPASLNLNTGDLATSKVTLSQIRDLFDFSQAYDSVNEGVAATVKDQLFYVYAEDSKLRVNEYLRTEFGATAVINASGTKKTIYIPELLKHIKVQVESFAKLRTFKPWYEGQVVYLTGYSTGSVKGAGEFVGHLGSKADDGGTVASGESFYWERSGYVDITPQMFGGIGDGITDESVLLEKLLNLGKRVLVSDDFIFGISRMITMSTSNSSLVGGMIKIIGNIDADIIRVIANDCEFSPKIWEGNVKPCYAGIRTYSGANRFKCRRVRFQNITSTGKALTCLWIETNGASGFQLEDLHFENIRNLGNGKEGDDDGSISLITFRVYADAVEGGSFDRITFNDVWCVDATGNKLVEDADAIKTMGGFYCPIRGGSVCGRNIGKRVIKTQAKGLHVEAVKYVHDDTTQPHRAVVDHQNSNNYVNVIQAKGFIASVYRTTSYAYNQGISASGYGSIDCETTYKSTSNGDSAIGVIDIGSGTGLLLGNTRVVGGNVGLRITAYDTAGIKDLTINANIESDIALVIRNINSNTDATPTGWVAGSISNVTVSGTFTSLANNTYPGISLFIANAGVIDIVRFANCTFNFKGTYGTGLKAVAVKSLTLTNILSNGTSGIDVELADVIEIHINDLNNPAADREKSVLRLQGVQRGVVSNVTGSKTVSTVGLIAAYGVNGVRFINCMNYGAGRDITFDVNGTTQCTLCYVGTTVTKVVAVSGYNDSNVIWDGAPAFGADAGRVGIVRRGFRYRSTDSNSSFVWSGFNWLAD